VGLSRQSVNNNRFWKIKNIGFMHFHIHIVLIFALQFLRHFPLGANSHIHPLMHYSQAISIFALQPLRDFPLETNKHIFSLELKLQNYAI